MTNPRIKACLAAAKALEAALAGEETPIPPGWFTRADFQEAKGGVSDAWANQILKRAVQKGALKSQPWKVNRVKVLIYSVNKKAT